MKKTFKMIGMACLLGAFAFAGSSCKKNDTDTTAVKMALPAVEETNIGEERAYIDWQDGRYMKWSKDDQVMFYNLNSDYTKSIRNVYTLYEGANTAVGHFHGNVMGDEQDLGYYAFYPAQKVEDYPLGPRNSQRFDVPAEQHYNEGTMDPTSLVMAVNGWAPTDNFRFFHIFGFLKVRIKGTESVEWVKVTDNDFHLTGDVTLDIPEVDYSLINGLVEECSNPAIAWPTYMADLQAYLAQINYIGHGTGKEVTLICDDPVQLNNDEFTDFFITLRPGALANGFVLTVKYENIADPVVYRQYDPTSEQWAYTDYYDIDHNQLYPRKFCIRPGNSMGARIQQQ
jgi:hypothetical protein